MTTMLRRAAILNLALLMILQTAPIVTAQRARRIQFARGRTTTILRGTLSARADARHVYLLRARAGQTLTAHITASGRGDAVFSIRAPSGTHVDEDHPIETDWSGELPQSGDYRITVFNPSAHVRGLVRYTLEITIR